MVTPDGLRPAAVGGCLALFSAVLSLQYMESWDPSCLLPFKKSSSFMWIYSFKCKYIPNSTIHSSASSLLWHYASERPAVPCCLSSSPFCPQLETGKTCCSVPVHESHWKLWWEQIKIAHENAIKISSSLAECQNRVTVTKGNPMLHPKGSSQLPNVFLEETLSQKQVGHSFVFSSGRVKLGNQHNCFLLN